MSSNTDASSCGDPIDDNGGSMIVNCPNFRRVCPEVRIFRSSRPDLLTDEEAEFFREKLGIRTILDMRSVSEYYKATGDKLVANYYNLYKLKIPQQRKYEREELVEGEPMERPTVSRCSSSSNSDSPSTPPPLSPEHPHSNYNTDIINAGPPPMMRSMDGRELAERRHYLLDVFESYPLLLFWRAPWYIKLYSMFVLLFDMVCRTGYRNFVGLYVRTTLNPRGILGQYKDMIEIGSTRICAALKLLSRPERLPALLNCTFGKDRTGVICALILACLGKDKDYISKNYAQSAVLLEKQEDVLRNAMTAKYQLDEVFITAREETMMELLDYIEEKYESVAGYMEYIGFSKEEQKILCQNICR